jgi:IMP dehydrogenase
MSIAEQAKQVGIVKRAENGMISNPVTIRKGATVGNALALMAEYKIGGIPVVDEKGYLVGIVTNRDLRFQRDMNTTIDGVMTKENLITTSRSTDLEAAADILQQYKIEKLPVVDKDNKLVGLLTYKDITKAKDKPMASKDAQGRLRVAAGVGVTADVFERIDALVEAGVDAIVIDTAHGHSQGVIDTLREAKKRYKNIENNCFTRRFFDTSKQRTSHNCISSCCQCFYNISRITNPPISNYRHTSIFQCLGHFVNG